MPRIVARTASELVGGSLPASLCAYRTAASLRPMLDGFRSRCTSKLLGTPLPSQRRPEAALRPDRCTTARKASKSPRYARRVASAFSARAKSVASSRSAGGSSTKIASAYNSCRRSSRRSGVQHRSGFAGQAYGALGLPLRPRLSLTSARSSGRRGTCVGAHRDRCNLLSFIREFIKNAGDFIFLMSHQHLDCACV